MRYLTRVGMGPWVAHLQSTCVFYLPLSLALSVSLLLEIEIEIYLPLPLFVLLPLWINRYLVQRSQSVMGSAQGVLLSSTLNILISFSLSLSLSANLLLGTFLFLTRSTGV